MQFWRTDMLKTRFWKKNYLAPTFVRVVTMGHMSTYDSETISVNVVVWSVSCYNIDHFSLKALCSTCVFTWCTFPRGFCDYMIVLLMWWGEVRRGKPRSRGSTINIKEDHIRQTMVKCRIRKKSCKSDRFPWAFGRSSLDSWLPTGGPS